MASPLWRLTPIGKGSVSSVRELPLKEGVLVDYTPVVKHGSLLGKMVYNAYAFVSYFTDHVIRPGYGSFDREETVLRADGGDLYPQLVSPAEQDAHILLTNDIANELQRNQYYIYKFIDGETISKVLASQLPESEKETMFNEAGRTLAAVHKKHILHGDYTLENGVYTQNKVRPIDPGVVLNEAYVKAHRTESQARDIVLFGLSLSSLESINHKEYLHAFLEGYLLGGGSQDVITEAKKYSLFKMFPNWIRFAFLEKMFKEKVQAGKARFDVHQLYRDAINSF
jgi:serine/threonine protein kinase